MEILPARGALLEEILDETWRIWSDGLSREAYARYNAAQMLTPWGRGHLDRVALVDGGHVLSSAKRYALRARLEGRVRRVLGIGAVFTPPSVRRRGGASALIERLLDEARREGVDCAILFSEIGAPYYQRFGFVPIERNIAWLRLREKPGAPAVLVRAGETRDLPAIVELLRVAAAPARFALDVDVEFLHFGLSKKRLLAGLSPAGMRHVEFFVAEEGASPVAFVLITRSRAAATLEACGDRDPSGARVGAILQALRARTPREPTPDIAAWLPPRFLPPQTTIVKERPAAELMMIKALRGDIEVGHLRSEDVVFWRGDAF
jgi:GNAT superfamily N-acetyltransferase